MKVDKELDLTRILSEARVAHTEVIRRGRSLAVDLPLPLLRQQAHLVVPASDRSMAEKALAGAHTVAARLLGRYGIEIAELQRRTRVDAGVIEELLSGGTAPVVVLDLEDAVAPQTALRARANAVSLLRNTERGSSLCFVRTDAVEDPRCADDLVDLLVAAGSGLPPPRFPLDGLVIPKVRHPDEVEWIEHVLAAVEEHLGLRRGRIRVSLQIETAWGVLNLPQLVVTARNRLAGLILGTVDLSADAGLPDVRYWHPFCEWARMSLVAAASAMGVPAIDGMTLDFPVALRGRSLAENSRRVLERMMADFDDCLRSIELGMSGRWTGHPLQLVAAELAFRSAFSPAAISELEERLGIFRQAVGSGRGAVAGSGGELLDIATDRHVQTLLRRAAAWGYLSPERAQELGVVSPTPEP